MAQNGRYGSFQRSLSGYNALAKEFVYALGVGVITAAAAICFGWMISAVKGASLSFFPAEAKFSIPLSISAGGLAVGLLMYWLARDLKGGGVAGVINSVFADKGQIPGRVAFIRMVSSALTIGTGGSAGREGPIVQIGASLGSSFARFFKLSEQSTVLMLACGVAAGISSAFNAPLAGVFFALEIILSRFSYHTFGMVVLSSVTSCAVTRIFVGDTSEFSVPIYTLANYWELLLFIGLGAGAAITGAVFTRSLLWCEKKFAALNIPVWLKPAAGGLLCGILAAFYPQIMGSGWNVMNEAVNGRLDLQLMLILVLAKIIGTSLTLGSGGAGGDLAPSLFIGCMFGGVYGYAVSMLLPGCTVSPGAYALVGMATVFAAAAKAPITAVFMIFESTSEYFMLMPLMAASVTAAMTASVIDRESIYTLKLSSSVLAMQRGEGSGTAYLHSAKVAEAADSTVYTISPHASVSEAVKLFKSYGCSVLEAVDSRGRLAGQLDRKDIAYWRMRKREDESADQTCVSQIMRTDIDCALPSDSLAMALHLMSRCRAGCIPVLESHSSRKLEGTIRRSRISEAFLLNSGTKDDFEEEGDRTPARFITETEPVPQKPGSSGAEEPETVKPD